MIHAVLYKISVGALLLGHALDSSSSFNHRELNPILATNGRFAGRGIAIKSGAIAVTLVALRKHRGASTVVNFAAGGLLSGIAVRNWRIR